MAKDVICGMNVDEKTAKLKSDYMGKTYYFCSQMCKTTFDKNPAKYAGGQSGHSMGHSCCGCC
jgi:YHS domain-containing protein